MKADSALRQLAASPEGLGDVLDQLTAAHAEMVARHGPLNGIEPIFTPSEPVAFAAEQVRQAQRIDQTEAPARKAAARIDKEARQHEQIGYLAVQIAGYHAAHGDPSDALPMESLGQTHLQIASELMAHVVDGWDEGETARAWIDGQPHDTALVAGQKTLSQLDAEMRATGGMAELATRDLMASFVTDADRAQHAADNVIPFRPLERDF